MSSRAQKTRSATVSHIADTRRITLHPIYPGKAELRITSFFDRYNLKEEKKPYTTC